MHHHKINFFGKRQRVCKIEHAAVHGNGERGVDVLASQLLGLGRAGAAGRHDGQRVHGSQRVGDGAGKVVDQLNVGCAQRRADNEEVLMHGLLEPVKLPALGGVEVDGEVVGGGTTIIPNTHNYQYNNWYAMSRCFGYSPKITLTGSTEFRVEHQCTVSINDYGFGYEYPASVFGNTYYTMVHIYKM